MVASFASIFVEVATGRDAFIAKYAAFVEGLMIPSVLYTVICAIQVSVVFIHDCRLCKLNFEREDFL